jgi:Peptidase inhibitor family I36/Domain of unknown function (DUF4214)
MNRITRVGLLMAAAILANVSIASAQRWGREATPQSGVCFYEDINFGGRYFCSPVGSTTTSIPSGMNDRISSVRVFGNAAVTLFRDPNFRGDSRVITSDIADLRAMGFNDRLSSYEVQSGRGYVRGGNGAYGTARERTYPNGNGAVYPNGNGVYSNCSRWTYRSAEAAVRQSYRQVLSRDPDPAGLRNWTQQLMNNNWTQRDLENALRQSDEYRALHNNDTWRTNRR